MVVSVRLLGTNPKNIKAQKTNKLNIIKSTIHPVRHYGRQSIIDRNKIL